MTHFNLASERMRLGLTQQQLGDELGYGVKTIGKWEKDATLMPGDVAVKAAGIFDCSLDYLMDLTEDRISHKRQIIS